MKYNIIIKPNKFDRFTTIPNYILRHTGISVGATGLYAYLFSHSSDQKITIEFISNHFKEGKDGIRSKLNELIELGYVEKIRVTDKGKFKGYNYLLIDKPKTEKPITEKPMSENPPQSNTNNNINNISNTNVLSHFINLFPKKFQPKTDAQIKKWQIILDQLQRIDKYEIRELYKIVKYIRDHHFWKNQFLSLPKLRNNDKNGDKWIYRFDAIYHEENKPNAYKKIKNLIEFKIYIDVDGEEKLGAITKTSKLNEYNLSQILDPSEISQLIKYLKNE